MEVITIGKSTKLHRSFPEHRHGYWEILLNTEGSGDMFITDVKYSFYPGIIFVLPPYTPHRKNSANGFRDISMFVKNFRPIGGQSLNCFLDDKNGSIQRTLELAWDFSQTSSTYENAVLNVMGDLVYQMLVCYFQRNQKTDLRLERVIRLMQENISNTQFDLSEIIQQSGYCKGYFRKIFKESLGETPVTYFNHLRIHHAKSLIQQYGPSRSIKDIATASGYKDSLYFSRLFRQYEGISPREYQRQIHDIDLKPVAMDTPTEFIP